MLCVCVRVRACSRPVCLGRSVSVSMRRCSCCCCRSCREEIITGGWRRGRRLCWLTHTHSWSCSEVSHTHTHTHTLKSTWLEYSVVLFCGPRPARLLASWTSTRGSDLADFWFRCGGAPRHAAAPLERENSATSLSVSPQMLRPSLSSRRQTQSPSWAHRVRLRPAPATPIMQCCRRAGCHGGRRWERRPETTVVAPPTCRSWRRGLEDCL